MWRIVDVFKFSREANGKSEQTAWSRCLLLLVLRRIVDVFEFSREANGKGGQTVLDTVDCFGHGALLLVLRRIVDVFEFSEAKRTAKVDRLSRSRCLRTTTGTAENRGRFRVSREANGESGQTVLDRL
jgi:hypothetical protein